MLSNDRKETSLDDVETENQYKLASVQLILKNYKVVN